MNLRNYTCLFIFSATTVTLVTVRKNTGRSELNSYSRFFSDSGQPNQVCEQISFTIIKLVNMKMELFSRALSSLLSAFLQQGHFISDSIWGGGGENQATNPECLLGGLQESIDVQH